MAESDLSSDCVSNLTVDFNRPLSEMIEAGRYDWVDENENIIRDNFPPGGQGRHELEPKLYHFNREISSEDAIKEMKADGFRPAVLEELLALGEAQPDLQKQFSIIALGSVWQSSGSHWKNVPVLFVCDVGRGLCLLHFEGAWSESDRFLAFRR
jgi:hypothetical protein